MRASFRRSLFVALVLCAAMCVPAAGADRPLIGSLTLLGGGPHRLDVGLGVFGFRHNVDRRSQAGRIELRIGKKLAYLGPAVGVLADRDGIRYAYGGIYADLGYRKFLLTPVLAMGMFRKGNNVDLGGPLEFRESLELSYRLTGRWRIGLSVAHVSNANIYRLNPGRQDLLVTCAAAF